MDDTNYADWTWETVLGTVLNIAMPDRSAVTGQQWLVIRHGDDTLPGAHEFWTASWAASSTKASGAISVYLNPALSDPAGPASLFQVAPDVLAGVPDGIYGTLPMQPPAFQPVGQVLANATDWFGTAAQQFNVMGQSLPGSNSGQAAQMFTDLFGRLGTVAASLHDQMSVPVTYANAIADTAGGAASRFLASLWSAYSAWTQQPAATPTGAIVQVLQAVGQLQPDGTYVITDPENTTYGDLTTDQAWATVEQQSKNLWLSLLTTGTGGFGGLDPLAHTALSSLIGQYDSAVNVLQPVTGAPPAARPAPADPPPVGGPNNPAGLGAAPGPTPAGPTPVGPVPVGGPVNLIALAPVPTPGTQPAPPPGGAPGSPPLVFGPALAQNASVVQSPLAGGPGAGASAGTVIGGPGAVVPMAAFAAGPAVAAAVPLVSASTLPAAGPLVFSGAIGAVSNDTVGALGDLAPPQASPQAAPGASLVDGVLLPVAIGKPNEASGQQAKQGNAAPNPNQVAAPARVAPVAGAAVGRGADGTALPQATVPTLAAKPPSIRSSAINTQLAAAVTSPGATLPAGIPHIGAADAPGGLVGPAGAPGANSGATGSGIVTSFMVDQNGEPYVGVNGPMMLPQATMGPGLGGGFGGQPMGRASYLPENAESWGTDPEEPGPDMAAPRTLRLYQPTPEEDEEVEIPSGFGAIGRRTQPS
jgi:hypothetical protein